METLNEKVKELRQEWLNEIIPLNGLDQITDTDMSGKYDLKRDLLMGDEKAGSYSFMYDPHTGDSSSPKADAESEINIEFEFVEGEEVDWFGKVRITDIYEL